VRAPSYARSFSEDSSLPIETPIATFDHKIGKLVDVRWVLTGEDNRVAGRQ